MAFLFVRSGLLEQGVPFDSFEFLCQNWAESTRYRKFVLDADHSVQIYIVNVQS